MDSHFRIFVVPGITMYHDVDPFQEQTEYIKAVYPVQCFFFL